MVNITKFKVSKHLEPLEMMHIAHEYKDMEAISQEVLPNIGYICYSNQEYQYVAAGFLRMVEGGYAQIDTLVTNPAIEPSIRHEAINLLVSTLIQRAKELKLKGIYALTLQKDIIERAEATGFRVIDHKVVALRL